ncbi:SCO1431 family membrane protein [Streptomyces sp. SID8382]|nr:MULTISPECIES: SCO1431 family membrane protein [unclassified Streptomyces]MCQ6249159.1 SCO1431 family membrane protein [Streptomyces malaysiensis]AUA13186.1 hypothetical protein CFP59_05341 [Streptomyces sp. M56]MYX57151.1 SCO1431 family membrane protein [Streptomyces sp. SID8382]WHX20402.1 SCO1431 family membrane protein [Streptomyces sp. NA07423]WPB92658.1 SCO1431 family membrane protein [Streptomyces malaysiensis]
MTDIAARRSGLHSRTGGPSDDQDQLLEQLIGWWLVLALALLTTQLGLI